MMYYGKDLPAADAVYHRTCNAHFRNNKDITTFSFYNIGKPTTFNLYLNRAEVQKLANIFISENRAQHEIDEAGLNVALMLYGGGKR